MRTLDSGESVRLQYRSLQKADGTATPLSLLHPSASAAGNPHPDSPPQATDLEDSPRSRLLFPAHTSPPSSSMPTNDSQLPYLGGGMGAVQRNSGSGSDAEARGGRGGSGEGPSTSRRESGGAEVFSKGGRMKGYVGGAWEEAHPGSDLSLKTKPRSPARVGKGGREWWGEKEERSEKKRKKGGRLEEALCEGREEVPRGPPSLKLGRSSLGTSLEGGPGGRETEAGQDGKEEETGWEWDGGKGLSRGWRGGKEVRWEDERGAHGGQEWQSKVLTIQGADAIPTVSVPPKKRDFGGGGFNAEGGKGGAYPVRTFLSNKSFSGSSPGREAMSPPRDRPPPPPLLSAGKEDSKAGAEVGDDREGAGEGVAGVNDER